MLPTLREAIISGATDRQRRRVIDGAYQTKPEPNTFWIDSTICACEITWTWP